MGKEKDLEVVQQRIANRMLQTILDNKRSGFKPHPNAPLRNVPLRDENLPALADGTHKQLRRYIEQLEEREVMDSKIGRATRGVINKVEEELRELVAIELRKNRDVVELLRAIERVKAMLQSPVETLFGWNKRLE